MKTISVIGTSLFNITIVAFVSLFLQIYINQNIDFVLALVLIVSSSVGAAVASRIVDLLDQENLKVTFGMLLLIISSFLAYDLFRTPENLFIINYVYQTLIQASKYRYDWPCALPKFPWRTHCFLQ